MRSASRRSAGVPPLLPALAVAGLVGTAWVVDARRREREAHRLHRILVDLLLNTLSAGDPQTARHSRRVADLTDALASTYGLSGRERARLRVAALLHDLGKIDDRFFDVLHSCEPLTEEQREKIEEHPHEGAEVLRPLERIHPGITRIVEAHHESWDGQGYPRGLAGEEIPLEARILSAADVFDALTQPRSYHDPLSASEALDRIRTSAGRRFDPEVVRRLDRPEVRSRWDHTARIGRAAEAREREEAEVGSSV